MAKPGRTRSVAANDNQPETDRAEALALLLEADLARLRLMILQSKLAGAELRQAAGVRRKR